jgi:protein involved in polysaccharide export with SLBB domain
MWSAEPCLAQSEPSAGPLRLRPGDSVRLEVRDEPALRGDFLVDDGGQVLLPILGLVDVAGRDFAEVRREVVNRFDRELERAEIRLIPLLRIAVLGEVRQPSLYPVDPTFTLLDVLALAGGLSPSADPRRVSLVRDGRTMELTMQAGSSALEAGLRSGDQVVVGRRSWLRENMAVVMTTAASIGIAVFTAVLVR